MSFCNFEKFRKTKNFNNKLYLEGTKREKVLLPLLQTYFKDPMIHSLPEGDVFDFKGKQKLIELKSRKNNRLTYPDTAIGMNKINAAQQSSDEVFFVFEFLNGLYYWKFDKSIDLRIGYINDIAHYFIPVNILTPIQDPSLTEKY